MHQEARKIIDEMRYQMKCNDALVKNLHPERDGLAMKLGHSQEMGNIHLNEQLRKLEALLGLDVNTDYKEVISDHNADYSSPRKVIGDSDAG